jgi:rhodanese-related sulfurtransferase
MIVLLIVIAAATGRAETKNEGAPKPAAAQKSNTAATGKNSKSADKKTSKQAAKKNEKEPKGLITIDAAKLKEMLKDKDALVIDVREPQELAPPLPALPGSKNIPLGKLLKKQNLVPKNKKIVIVCRSGHRSAVAAEALLNNGFATVYTLGGGLLKYYGQ